MGESQDSACSGRDGYMLSTGMSQDFDAMNFESQSSSVVEIEEPVCKKRKAEESDVPALTRSRSKGGKANNKLTIKGLVCTDASGSTYVPQKLMFGYNTDNKNHSALIDTELDSNAKKWNEADGCSCRVFSASIDIDFTPPTVIAGLTHGFGTKFLPPAPSKKGQKKKAWAKK